MKLIGMLDSPYVRRVAVSLQCLGLPFEHESISVFRGLDAFRRINPVVKAPTLVCDDGTVLMDSTLILQWAESLAAPRSLTPREPAALRRELRLIGLALAATEKSVQLVYERALRPAEKQHAPWIERVTAQLQAACAEIERELERAPVAVERATIGQAGIALAVGWRFIREATPDAVPAPAHPRLAALSAAAEALPEFRAAPHGEGTVQPIDGARSPG